MSAKHDSEQRFLSFSKCKKSIEYSIAIYKGYGIDTKQFKNLLPEISKLTKEQEKFLQKADILGYAHYCAKMKNDDDISWDIYEVGKKYLQELAN